MNKCFVGDCRDTMSDLIEQGIKVQMCVTSPPYFGLRDYGHPSQIGLEPTPQEYVKNMVEVFRLVRDLLADDGVLWLNMGDSYSSGGRKTRDPGQSKLHPAFTGDHNRTTSFRPDDGAKPKDLLGIPWRVAFALQEDGWYLRQDIIWHKPNPMPESVRDRCTKAHEYIFLLSKNPRYYFDNEAIKEPAKYGVPNSPKSIKSPHGQGFTRRAKVSDNRKELRSDVESRHRSAVEGGQSLQSSPNGKRNKRSVWTVSTKPYKGAHFAVFPPELIEPCVLAGSKPGDIVLDPFGGSGTTAQIAQENGRNWILCELNEEYSPLQKKRMENCS